MILTTNGLRPARRQLERLLPSDFAYVQVSVDGGTAASNDKIRGKGTFNAALETIGLLCKAGFDTRIICTVNKLNMDDCLQLLPIADTLGVSLVKYHVFSGIGNGRDKDGIDADDWLVEPEQWIAFYEYLETQRALWNTRIWYQPTYAKRERVQHFVNQGYRGCIGRTLDRLSVFPDGRAYVCSYLFDTDLHFAFLRDGRFTLNKGENEFDLFARGMTTSACSDCKVSGCMGGCPAEEIVMGQASCASIADIVPICRLWKSDI